MTLSAPPVLHGVIRQLEEAKVALRASRGHLLNEEYDPAYRLALDARNLLFHATRGVAATRGEPLPEMPTVGIPGGSEKDADAGLAALEGSLQVHDPSELAASLHKARLPFARYLGFVRGELGKHLPHSPR